MLAMLVHNFYTKVLLVIIPEGWMNADFFRMYIFLRASLV